MAIVGEKVLFSKRGEETADLFTIGTRACLPNEVAEWYSTEDGHVLQRTVYDDLDFLQHMPNLQIISIGLADLTNPPDLKGMKNLGKIWISDCRVENLEWIRGCGIREFLFNGSGDQDFSPLTDCEKLEWAQIDLWTCHGADFSGFAPPALQYFRLGNAHNIPRISLDRLHECTRLREMEIENIEGGIRNLDFLEGMTSLRWLYVGSCNGLTNISAVGSLTGLRNLSIQRCYDLQNYSAVGGCTGLEMLCLEVNWDYRITNADWIADMPDIREMHFYGCNFKNVDFLDSIPSYRTISFSYAGSLGDASALGRRKHYDYMHLNPESHDYATIAPYLKDATVDHLMLYEIRKLDLSQLPKVGRELEIYSGRLENLRGLSQPDLQMLILRDMDYLTSLEGLEGLKRFTDEKGTFGLEIYGCPRLQDWSALEGKYLRSLSLYGTYMVPDLSTFRTLNLKMDYPEIDDLQCLAGLNPEYRMSTLEIYTPDEIQDLLPAWNLQGSVIKVSPQFREVAQAMVDEKHFSRMEINYPDHSWQEMSHGFRLLNLEEIDTLPARLLAKVDRIHLAGDRIVDPENANLRREWDWESKATRWIINDWETGENWPVTPGTMTDLSRIAKLTGLKNMWIVCQPLENLNGAEGMLQLETVDIEDCDRLEDISALFTLESLQRIQIESSPVRSIQGIQNLPQLTQLNLNQTKVTDILPLAECDLGFAERQGGLSLSVQGEEPVQDLSPLDGIRTYGEVFLDEEAAETWLQHLQGADIRYLNINRMNGSLFKLLEGIRVENLEFGDFRLDNLEEIDSLSQEMREKITDLCIIGDQLYESDGDFELQEEWKGNKATPMLENRWNGEKTQVKMGTGIDLSRLRLLPNLKNLTLAVQPITDLQALEGMDKLERLDLRFCTKLTDLSALASLTSLEELNLNQCRSVKDLTPLTGLKNILELAFNGVQADWSALEHVDFTRAGQDRGLSIMIDNSKEKLMFLAGVKRFSNLALAGIKPELWMEFISGAQVNGIHNSALNQKQFEQLLDEHPEIREISIPNSKVTDLTKLLSMPNIERVTVSQNMKKALKSIEGAEYSFRVEMW